MCWGLLTAEQKLRKTRNAEHWWFPGFSNTHYFHGSSLFIKAVFFLLSLHKLVSHFHLLIWFAFVQFTIVYVFIKTFFSRVHFYTCGCWPDQQMQIGVICPSWNQNGWVWAGDCEQPHFSLVAASEKHFTCIHWLNIYFSKIFTHLLGCFKDLCGCRLNCTWKFLNHCGCI